MKNKLGSLVLFAGIAAGVPACEAVRDGMMSHRTVVARVDQFTLTIDHAAELLATASPEVAPDTAAIADVLTQMWVGYTSLAIELAGPDSLEAIDVAPLAKVSSGQELVWNLHRTAILDPAEPAEAELRELYEQERPYDRVEVWHILVRIPDDATSAQEDSLRRYAESLRRRVTSGEDFEDVARRFSGDPATASRGGRLGWYRRGALTPEFERTVFTVEPGQITEPIRSPFGYHIARVTNRDAPEFDEAKDGYLNKILDERVPAREERYLDSLQAAAQIRFAPGAEELTRQLARSVKLTRLSPAERGAKLIIFKGGSVTAGDFADFLLRRRNSTRRLFLSDDSAEVRARLLETIVRNKLLVSAALSQGYSLNDVQADSIERDARRELYAAATVSGFFRTDLVPGDSAIKAGVDRAIKQALARQRSPEPVRRLSPALWPAHSIQIYPHRFPAVAARLAQIRDSLALPSAAPRQMPNQE